MSDWCIGLSSWIIQDGNYDDFHRHQECRFAVEFFPMSFTPSQSLEKTSRHLRSSEYEVCAEVVLITNTVWIIDFGILAYQESPPPKGLSKGDWINATVDLGVDPFFYFERLSQEGKMPPLIYTWHIQKIQIETAQFIETKDAIGTRYLARDESKSAYRLIERTDAWSDDDGNAEYVLNCTLLSQPPKRDLG